MKPPFFLPRYRFAGIARAPSAALGGEGAMTGPLRVMAANPV